MAKELNETTLDQVADDQQPASITAADLSLVVRIIDAGSSRGAWRGEELTVVGGLRDKLISVLKVVSPESFKTAETDEATTDNASQEQTETAVQEPTA